jgi:phage tail-like protein
MTVSNVVARRESSYLKFLPAIYRDDELMGQLLLIFESILSPIERSIDNLAAYLDPLITPGHFLTWLASWLDFSLDPTWPEPRRRELIKSAAELYRWRGTRRGMIRYISIYTGVEPEIIEYIPAMMLDNGTKMGLGAQLGGGGAWHHFTIVVPLDKNSKMEDSNIRIIIENQKPAHSTYTLRFKPVNRE